VQPLPAEITIDLFCRLAARSPRIGKHEEIDLTAGLDESLLSLSLRLWNDRVPIHKFPPSLLAFLPHPRSRQHSAHRRSLELSRIEKPKRNRCLQFLYEAERVSALESVMYLALSPRLPPELVEYISGFCLSSLDLPRSLDFSKVWIPWPRHQMTTSGDARTGRIRRELMWSRVERRFVRMRKPNPVA
jgi:hypothetical protein